MSDYNTIVLPSKPKVVREEENTGVYEVDGLYPGYGHTLGNSLRRIILSSLPGAAITSVKIDGVDHEFSTISGVKEDVIMILLNLKKIRIELLTDEPQTISLTVKGVKEVVASDLTVPSQVRILNPEAPIATLTEKQSELSMELRVEKGIGYIPKEVLQKERAEIGSITLDAIFTPIRRVNYEVENMRVGDRTDFNRLRIFIETDGIISPRQALEHSIATMINQLKAIVGFKEDGVEELYREKQGEAVLGTEDSKDEEVDPDILKTRIESLDLSSRTLNALSNANVRTVGGLVRKREDDILDIPGMGTKGVEEIREKLSALGVSLKQ